MKSLIFLVLLCPVVFADNGTYPLSRIEGTDDMASDLYYKIGMKKFENKGWITWTQTEITGGGGNYLQIGLNPNDNPHYEEGKKWWNDVQFQFVPSEIKGWYTIKLRSAPEGIIVVKYDKATDYKHLVIIKDKSQLSAYAPNGKDRSDALFRLGNEGNKKHYQLKVKSIPDGVITWTAKKYGEYSYYIQVTEADKTAYQKGGKYYDDTLFYFVPITQGFYCKYN